MGLAKRAQALIHKQVIERAEKRAAEARQRQAAADEYHRLFLGRERAAEFLGISVHRLKRLMTAGTGPTCLKNGTTKQSGVVWPLSELEAWKADPRGYIAARNAAPG